MSATIKYKGNTIASITTDSSKTLKTSGKYCEGDIIIENTKDGITPSGNKAITATTSTQTGIDVTNYATVSVAPTPSETKSVTTNGDVTPSSGKLLSKVTVNVPTGTARDSSDLTVSGATVNVPAGLYSSAASKSVASGTAGTPTASKSAVSNNSVTVTPSVTNTEGYITGGTKTGTGVKVSASELVSGNKAITPSETAQSGIDVTNFKTASVGAISPTYVGSGVTRKAAATVAPSTSEQTVCASGVYTTGEQKVSAITPSIVGNLDASIFAASIVAAVEGKGVTVPSGTLLDGMAALIEASGISFSDFKYNFSKVYYGDITFDMEASLSSYPIIIDAPGIKEDLHGAQIIIVTSDDTAYSTSHTTLAAAMQFMSSVEQAHYSNPVSLMRFGAESRFNTSGKYTGGVAGAIYDADGNVTNLAYYTHNILNAKVVDNKIHINGRSYNKSDLIPCAAKTYHCLLLSE